MTLEELYFQKFALLNIINAVNDYKAKYGNDTVFSGSADSIIDKICDEISLIERDIERYA